MSQEERDREIGSLVHSYKDAETNLACLQGRADRYLKLFGTINGLLQGIQYSPAEMPDMATYPTREQVDSLLKELPEAKKKVNSAVKRLEDAGLPLSRR